jgi:hypothetical protein
MAKKPRPFCALPAPAMADTSLTALDLRCLAVIAWHDGMSGATGKGGGCFARNDNMAAIINTDPTNFSKCLTKLIRLGYVTREPQIMDKRRFTLRVQYPTDNSWRDDQLPNPLNVGEQANHSRNVVGDGEHGNGSFSKENAPDYISLNEELHFDESSERNSTKWRDLEIAKIKSAEAGLGRESIRALMSPTFDTLDSAAQVAQIQRGFSRLDHDPNRIIPAERSEMTSLLFVISDHFAEHDFGQQAQRLLEEMDYD